MLPGCLKYFTAGLSPVQEVSTVQKVVLSTGGKNCTTRPYQVRTGGKLQGRPYESDI